MNSTHAETGPMQDSINFHGESFDPERDGKRLARQMAIVREVMGDGRPHTLDELAKAARCSTASASARCRDLRKAAHGGNIVTRAWLGNGVWSYTMFIRAPA